MPSLDNIDIPTLRNAIEHGRKLMDMAFPVVEGFDAYAERIVSRAAAPERKKILAQELSVLTAARQDVHDHAKACELADLALAQMSKRDPAATLSKEQKAGVSNVLVDLHLSLFEAMQIVYRATPERNKLHQQAVQVLSRLAAQPLMGGVN